MGRVLSNMPHCGLPNCGGPRLPFAVLYAGESGKGCSAERWRVLRYRRKRLGRCC
ncbi:hypothetical protein J22TS3_38370 [Paenibacillus sp. J22TS3]|nr:hypothetical protein J22TS3_38370 [Paenibacillus sp. J22TS3]